MNNPLLVRKLNGEKKMATGSIFIRDAGQYGLPKGKKMVMIMGVIAVDEKDFPFETETMTQVVGFSGKDNMELVLVNPKKQEGLEAFGADRIFCESIWRA